MNKLSRAVKRHPFVTFGMLAYALAWWMWPLYVLDLAPAPIVGFGPFLAAVAVLGLTRGRPAVRELLGQMLHWRVGLRWYAIALGAPVVISGLAAAFNVLLGAPPPEAERLAQWPSLAPTFIMLLLIPTGGAWEEPGWRGFALPRLAAGRSQLTVALIIGPIWAGWHLPLLLTGIIPWADLLFIIGTTVLLSWVYYRSGKSLLLVMIFHAMNNAVGQFFPTLFSGAYVDQLALLQADICAFFALLLLIGQWRFWTVRPAPRPMAAARPAGH